MQRTPQLIPGVILLAIIATVLWVAVGVFNDAREGFCAQLEPCHTEETQQ